VLERLTFKVLKTLKVFLRIIFVLHLIGKRYIYDLGGYDLAIDYSQKLEPFLANEDAKWAAQILGGS
jgi:hypothetical protein